MTSLGRDLDHPPTTADRMVAALMTELGSPMRHALAEVAQAARWAPPPAFMAMTMADFDAALAPVHAALAAWQGAAAPPQSTTSPAP
jgi:hypothetical protein